jgi:hypothetical protein
VQYDYDDAGRTRKAYKPASTVYADNIAYAAHGPVASLLRGTLTEAWTFNNRLQPSALSVHKQSANRLLLGLGYGTSANNGNLLQQVIPTTPAARLRKHTSMIRGTEFRGQPRPSSRIRAGTGGSLPTATTGSGIDGFRATRPKAMGWL